MIRSLILLALLVTHSAFAGLPPVSGAAVGASPNSKGFSVVGNKITLEPANASFPGVLSSSDWSTFNAKQPAGNYALGFTYANDRWVDITNGNDSTGDGSVLNPWKTISHAEAQITTATLSTPWTVYVVGSGQYFDAGLVSMKPNINIFSDSPGGLVVQSDMTINAIAGQDGSVLLYNLTIFSSLTYNGVAATTASLQLINCYTSSLTYKADSINNGYLVVSGGLGLYNADIQGYAYLVSAIVLSPLTIEDGSPIFSVTGSNLDGVTVNLKGNSRLEMSGNTKPAAVIGTVVSAVTPTLAADSVSMPTAISGSVSVDYSGIVMQQSAVGSQPACSSSNRGLQWLVQGGTGVADILQVCQKNVADAYVWTVH